MNDGLKATALLIYNESLEWVLDFVEDELDFQTTIINFENTTSKFYQGTLNLRDYLDEDIYNILLSIESLFEQRAITLYGSDPRYRLSEKELRSELEAILASA